MFFLIKWYLVQLVTSIIAACGFSKMGENRAGLGAFLSC